MAKRNGVRPAEREWELEGSDPFDQKQTDRVVVLIKEPLPRKVQLMNAGVREIRCVCCVRIKSIAAAEELGEGWICEDCLRGGTARLSASS